MAKRYGPKRRSAPAKPPTLEQIEARLDETEADPSLLSAEEMERLYDAAVRAVETASAATPILSAERGGVPADPSHPFLNRKRFVPPWWKRPVPEPSYPLSFDEAREEAPDPAVSDPPRALSHDGINAAFPSEEIAAEPDDPLAAFAASQDWLLPELFPKEIPDGERRELERLADLFDPVEIALENLAAWLPCERERLGGLPSLGHVFVLLLRELCRAEMQILAFGDDGETAFAVSCRAIHYEDRLHGKLLCESAHGGAAVETAEQTRTPKVWKRRLSKELREKSVPKSEAGRRALSEQFKLRVKVLQKQADRVDRRFLQHAEFWLGLAEGARNSRQLFSWLSRIDGLFDRLAPGAALATVAPPATRTLQAFAFCNAFFQLRREENDERRAKWAANLYRALLSRMARVEQDAAFRSVQVGRVKADSRQSTGEEEFRDDGARERDEREEREGVAAETVESSACRGQKPPSLFPLTSRDEARLAPVPPRTDGIDDGDSSPHAPP